MKAKAMKEFFELKNHFNQHIKKLLSYDPADERKKAVKYGTHENNTNTLKDEDLVSANKSKCICQVT